MKRYGIYWLTDKGLDQLLGWPWEYAEQLYFVLRRTSGVSKPEVWELDDFGRRTVQVSHETLVEYRSKIN